MEKELLSRTIQVLAALGNGLILIDCIVRR